MRKVITIPEVTGEKECFQDIDITHYLDPNHGWILALDDLSDYDKVVYLGKCLIDGDMFACYAEDKIVIAKGDYNDGTY